MCGNIVIQSHTDTIIIIKKDLHVWEEVAEVLYNVDETFI